MWWLEQDASVASVARKGSTRQGRGREGKAGTGAGAGAGELELEAGSWSCEARAASARGRGSDQKLQQLNSNKLRLLFRRTDGGLCLIDAANSLISIQYPKNINNGLCQANRTRVSTLTTGPPFISILDWPRPQPMTSLLLRLISKLSARPSTNTH